MYLKRALTLPVFALTLVLGSHADGQQKSADPDSPPPASIDDLAWIAGHWTGQAMGGDFEETWNPPMGGTIIGMFKFVKDDSIVFYEFLTVVPKDGSLMLRLKHFDAGLKGWEEKDESVEFPLVELSDTEAKFDGLVFKKINDNEMRVSVVVKQGENEPQELVFDCKRVSK